MATPSETDPSPLMDPDSEHPIPLAWRPTFSAIVDCFVAGDFELRRGVEFVSEVDDPTATGIRDNVADYGSVTLSGLTAETWDTSIAIWNCDHWETLVDLRTAEEGRSDLVLSTNVHEHGSSFRFHICMVYVP